MFLNLSAHRMQPFHQVQHESGKDGGRTMQRSVGLMRTDMSMMVRLSLSLYSMQPMHVLMCDPFAVSEQTFRGRTNAIVEIGKRMCQSDDEWKEKCAAMKELKGMFQEYAALQRKKDLPSNTTDAVATDSTNSKVDVSLFTPENIQALTQPFRTTVCCIWMSAKAEQALTSWLPLL